MKFLMLVSLDPTLDRNSDESDDDLTGTLEVEDLSLIHI